MAVESTPCCVLVNTGDVIEVREPVTCVADCKDVGSGLDLFNLFNALLFYGSKPRFVF